MLLRNFYEENGEKFFKVHLTLNPPRDDGHGGQLHGESMWCTCPHSPEFENAWNRNESGTEYIVRLENNSTVDDRYQMGSVILVRMMGDRLPEIKKLLELPPRPYCADKRTLMEGFLLIEASSAGFELKAVADTMDAALQAARDRVAELENFPNTTMGKLFGPHAHAGGAHRLFIVGCSSIRQLDLT